MESQPLLARKGKDGFSAYLVFVIISSVIGGTFQFGYNTGVINQPENEIRGALSNCTAEEVSASDCAFDKVSTLEWSAVVSIFCVGGLIGGVSGGLVANIIGRKPTLLLNNIFLIAGGLFMGLATNVYLLMAGRFFVGIGSGVGTVVCPMYLAEIAVVSLRGATGTMNQMAIVLGILISEVLGMSQLLGTITLWRWLLGFTVVPSVIQLIAMLFAPESPRWLYMVKHDVDGATAILRRLRGRFDVADEIDLLECEKEKMLQEKQLSLGQLLTSKDLRLALVIGLGLMIGQQLSGINSIFYFSNSIFESAHVVNEELVTSLLGTLNVVMTIVVIFLIDRAGRRPLLLYGFAGMTVFFAVLTVAQVTQSKFGDMSYVAVVSVMLVIVFFAVGPGAVAWVVISEIFPASASSRAVSISVGVNWFANFIVGLSFPSMQGALNDYTFLVFVGLCSAFTTFVFFFVPETKGHSIDEIQSILQRRSRTQAAIQ